MNLRYFDIQGTEKERGFLEFALEILPDGTISGVRMDLDYIAQTSDAKHSITITPKEERTIFGIKIPEEADYSHISVRDPAVGEGTWFGYKNIHYTIYHRPQKTSPEDRRVVT